MTNQDPLQAAFLRAFDSKFGPDILDDFTPASSTCGGLQSAGPARAVTVLSPPLPAATGCGCGAGAGGGVPDGGAAPATAWTWSSRLVTVVLFALVVGLVLYIFFQMVPLTRHFGAAPKLPTVQDAGGRALPSASSGDATGTITDPAAVPPVTGDATPTFVMFFASWCGHCKHLMPHFEALARKYAGRARFVKVEDAVLQKSGKASQLAVSGYPHVAFVRDGAARDKMVGNQGPDKLDAFIKQSLAGSG